MTNRLGVLFLLVGAAAASPAFAGDSATMKCNATNDRVWVYDSLTSFDVSAKLKCGETVEITGRVKGYVKIRAANGAQGYVPESTFPDLPPYVDPTDSQAGASIAKRVAPRATAPAPSMAS
ncbi:MAG: SH3 domain-containing protein, partial [Candidatus Acidiferrales bacterium]